MTDMENMQQQNTGRGILAKMLAVQKQTAIFEQTAPSGKTGKDGRAEYRYAKAVDIIRHFHRAMTEQGLLLRTDVTGVRTVPAGGGLLYHVDIECTVIDTQTGETYGPVRAFGAGMNDADKGFGCAETNAKKYFLFNNFLTGTDDPADEIDAQRRTGRQQQQTVQGAYPPGVQMQGFQQACAQGYPQGYPQDYAQVYTQGWPVQNSQPQYPQPAAPGTAYSQGTYRQPLQPAQPAQQAPAAAAGTVSAPSLEGDINVIWDENVGRLASITDEAQYREQTRKFMDYFSNLTGNSPTAFSSELTRSVAERRFAPMKSGYVQRLAALDENTEAYRSLLAEFLQQMSVARVYDGSVEAMRRVRQEIAAARQPLRS